MLEQLAEEIGPSSQYSQDLLWFAEMAVFGVHVAHDGILLQSYKLRHRVQEEQEQEQEQGQAQEQTQQGDVYVFSCGWSETVLKYARCVWGPLTVRGVLCAACTVWDCVHYVFSVYCGLYAFCIFRHTITALILPLLIYYTV